MKLNPAQVIANSDSLMSFPATIGEILETIADPDANLKVLVRCINHDPVIAARVLSVANAAAMRARRDGEVTDIYTAASLIGTSRVREITLISSLQSVVAGLSGSSAVSMWEHAVAVGICCQELAAHSHAPVSADAALMAGLLHDIGQFWLRAVVPVARHACLALATRNDTPLEQAERECFGVDHATLGAWLAAHWHLQSEIVDAIAGHHEPDAFPHSDLAQLVHVGEVMSNALELSMTGMNRVTYLSSAACKRLGLVWDRDVHALFGRIESRARYANAFFAIAGT